MTNIGIFDHLINREPWTDGAECASVDPELFHPENGGTTKPAKRICGLCEVRAECLNFALTNDIRHGVYGGLSARDRRNMLRRTA